MMKVWLLTWQSHTTAVGEPLAAILPARRSEAAVAELMELLVLSATAGAKFAAFCANRSSQRMYKAKKTIVINGVPHGDRITCGHDPWLYGRKVTSFGVDVDQAAGEEVLSWTEPNEYRFVEEGRLPVEIARPGRNVTVRRRNVPIARDVWEARGEA